VLVGQVPLVPREEPAPAGDLPLEHIPQGNRQVDGGSNGQTISCGYFQQRSERG
jgi:hypothetical protein